MIAFTYNDGGRAETGRRGKTGDCVVRAIAIALEQDYDTVYAELHDMSRAAIARHRKPRRSAAANDPSPRTGTSRKVMSAYLARYGWTHTATMSIGSGCRVHLRADELPAGRLIVNLSRHVAAVIDGTVHDTFDPSRDGTRCVYGYWSES